MTVVVYLAVFTITNLATGEERKTMSQYSSMAECEKGRNAVNANNVVRDGERITMQCWEHRIDLVEAIKCGAASRVR